MTKKEYYQELAYYYAASTYISRVDSVVMLEDMRDEWYWRQVLEHYRPLKYDFVAGTQGIDNRGVSTGCEQCLKFRGFLSRRFFVCMDSDFRYLKGENISASEGLVQTYTYSWENHCAFVDRMPVPEYNFDFAAFLLGFSVVAHYGLMFLMHVMKAEETDFTPKTLRGCLSQQYRKGDEKNDGKALIKRVASSLETAIRASACYASFDYEAMTAEFEVKGVTKENAYLYVRGHNVYDMLNSIGSKLSEGKISNFENAVLKADICHYNYPEIQKVGADIAQIDRLGD